MAEPKVHESPTTDYLSATARKQVLTYSLQTVGTPRLGFEQIVESPAVFTYILLGDVISWLICGYQGKLLG